MLESGYFDSEIIGYDEEGMPIFDRGESSDFLAMFISKLITSGVLAEPGDCFQVVAGEGMKLKVRPGFGIVRGRFAFDDAEFEVTVPTAPTVNRRIDRVILRANYLQRYCEIIVREGTPGTSPVPPELLRPEPGDYYELGLATVVVNSNQTVITQTNITDTRYDSQVCGVVTQAIDHLDTSVFFAQLNQFYEEFVERSDGSYDKFVEDMGAYLEALAASGDSRLDKIVGNLTEFETLTEQQVLDWFETVQGIINEDAAMKFSQDITALQGQVEELEAGKVDKAGDRMSGDLEVDGTVTADGFVGNATSATKIATKRNINGIKFDGTANAINYATCSTEADVPEKTVECLGFSLITGAEITVKFTVTNTAANPKLNVNGTGAKPIYYRGAAIGASAIRSDDTHTFRYNGKQWDYVGVIDSNTWKANTASSDGYVKKGGGNPNKAWGTDTDGNPGWRDMDEFLETSNLKSVVKSLILASHPIGSIEVNVTGANPSTYLGGTWVAWGSGRVPVGVNSSDADFSTPERTGGAKSRTHAHTVPGHVHAVGAHAHSIPNHAHTMAHTHVVPSHSHKIDDHRHTQTMRFQSNYVEAAGGGVKYTNGESVPTNVIYTGYDGSKNTWTSGDLTTNGASTSNTGTASNMSTNNSAVFNSGNCGDFASGNASFSILQPFITCYMWKRTA